MSQVVSVSVYVHDLDAARAFYVQALGFKVEESMGDYGFKLSNGDTTLVILSGGARTPAKYPGGIVLGIPTPNAATASEQLQKQGFQLVVSTPEPFPLGRFIAVADPSGNVIELLELSKHSS